MKHRNESEMMRRRNTINEDEDRKMEQLQRTILTNIGTKVRNRANKNFTL